jgi:hypothetical protein
MIGSLALLAAGSTSEDFVVFITLQQDFDLQHSSLWQCEPAAG